MWAIGDLVPGLALAHKASDEGIIAVEDAAGLETHAIEYVDVPRATFCNPNVASFGLTEEQAREAGHDVTVGKLQYGAVGAGTVYGDRSGLIKIVGDKRYGELLGGHIIGSKATELIQELVNAKQLEGGYPEVARIVHGHPTLSEAVMEAARAADGWHPRLTRPSSPCLAGGVCRRRARAEDHPGEWVRCFAGDSDPSHRWEGSGAPRSAISRFSTIERATGGAGLQPVRWPIVPLRQPLRDARRDLRQADRAHRRLALAAYRRAFAGGRAAFLSPTTSSHRAAACEMHHRRSSRDQPAAHRRALRWANGAGAATCPRD